MPRAIWTGTISFGLVTIPVKLYSAVSRKTVRFSQLNGQTGARIAQKRVDSVSGDEVPYEQIVKGYELAPERYVVMAPGELESLDAKKTRTIEIEDFVQAADIDPIYYDHPYYLAPATGGAKPYRLLLEAMRESGRVAIAKVVIRSKESLVAVRPMGEVLAMSTMVFADEVLDAGRLDELADVADVEVNERELAIAEQLVASLSGDWEPGKYRDEYREAVLELIERKASGEDIVTAPVAAEAAPEVPDLMSALQASLDAVKARGGAGTGKAPVKKAAAKAAGAKKPAAAAKAKAAAAKKPAAAKKAPAKKA